MKSLSLKRRIFFAAIALLLFLFLLRPGASRLKSRIAGSISAAMGRPVEIGSVHLRFLPRPGFDLENLVVYDDPAYGAEPMLRAGEVTASLRLLALWRGRIEISRLDLTEPSLNLVHGSNGRWNLEALIERASQTPLAPTGSPRPGSQAGFPYIEASSGRINFKNVQEKTPYALTNADFALWQDSENTWGVRLKAQPFRSDINLSDTGLLRVNGTWRRAASLRDTALQFSVEWDRPQLGQLTRFFRGDDMGWRGTALLDVNLEGTPAKLQVSSDASIRDFRRYDISSGQSLRLAAHCDAQYSSIDRVLRELFCQAPVGNGALTLHGSLGFPGSHEYNLVAVAQNIPANALAALGQHLKKNISEDLSASGSFEGDFSFRRNGSSGNASYAGRGKIAALQLISIRSKTQVNAGDIALSLNSSRTENGSLGGQKASLVMAPRLEFGPSPESVGHPIGRSLRGWVDRSGYNISLAGEVEVERVLALARLVGLPALTANAEGMARVNLELAGGWTGQHFRQESEIQQPQVTGTAKLHNVHVEIRGVDGPVEIAGADLRLTPTDVLVTRLSASAAHTLWTGSLALPRGCGTAGACLVQFNLNTNQVALADLSQWANPRPKDQPWYRALTSVATARPGLWAGLRASGTVIAGRLMLRDIPVNRVSANIELVQGKLRVSQLRGDILGGKYQGEWSADFTAKPAAYSSVGTLAGISLTKVGDAMRDDWITGSASGSYKLTASGATSAEFWRSAEGTVKYEMADGSLPHISLLAETGAFKIEKLAGQARLRNGSFESTEGRLDSPAGKFVLNGTASLHRELDLTLTRSSMAGAESSPRSYTITGTLGEPQVLQSAPRETQAQLKQTPPN